MRPTHLETRYKHDLSPRQREVMHWLKHGLTNAEIADRLDVSLDGAKYHVREILGKLGAESREEAVQIWQQMPTRRRWGAPAFLATSFARVAIGTLVFGGSALLVVVIVALASRDNGRTAGQNSAEATPSPVPMASATLPAVATQPLPTVDCGSTVEFGLETVDRGDEVLVRLSAKGADTCTLQGQVLLWLIRPVVDPGPDYPPEANVTRQMKLLIDFPFDGVIGEWTWRNWCAEPMPWVIWQAKFSGPNGPTAQLSNDFWPSCTAEGEPTWATRELFVNGLEGDPTPDSACLRAGYVGWLCEFATTVADKSTRGGTRLFDYPGGPTTESYFLCDGNGSAPGLVNSTLCAGRPANESIPGYWLATPKNADAYVSLADLTAQVTRALATSPQLLAVSCAGGSDCSRFALTFGDANAPAVTLIYRLERGREPALIGAALGSTPSGLSSPFGEFSLEPLGARGN